MKVSVAMITYNHEAFIAEAIEGILMQETDFAFEIVIGEDCSTDRTREILLDYANRYPDKIRLLLREHNVGAEINYMETMDACRGEYIAILDGDDYWTAPDKLQTQADFLDEHPGCSMCFHSVVWLDDDGKQFVFSPPAKRNSIYTLRDLLHGNFISSLSTMERATCFSGFLAGHKAGSGTVGDWQHHLLVASHGDIGYIDKAMGVRRVQSGGAFSALGKIERIRTTMRTLKLLDGELGSQFSSDIRRAMAGMLLHLAKIQLDEGLRNEAQASLNQSFRTAPIGRHTLSRKMARVLLQLYLPFVWARLSALRRKIGSDA